MLNQTYPPHDPDPWETLQQAAARVHVNEKTLRRLIHAGALRHARVGLGKKNIRLRRSWVDAALEASVQPVEAA